MERNPNHDPVEQGLVVHLDPNKERQQIEAHRAARRQQLRQDPEDEATSSDWTWAVLAIVAMIAIVIAAYLLLVAGPGNPSAPLPCMPPSCV